MAIDNIGVSEDFTQEDARLFARLHLVMNMKFYYLWLSTISSESLQTHVSQSGRNLKPCGSCQSGSGACEVTKWKGKTNASPELCCNYYTMLSVIVANKTLHIQSWLSIAKIYDILYIITQSYLFIQKQKNLDLTPLKKFWKVILVTFFGLTWVYFWFYITMNAT